MDERSERHGKRKTGKMGPGFRNHRHSAVEEGKYETKRDGTRKAR